MLAALIGKVLAALMGMELRWRLFECWPTTVANVHHNFKLMIPGLLVNPCPVGTGTA